MGSPWRGFSSPISTCTAKCCSCATAAVSCGGTSSTSVADAPLCMSVTPTGTDAAVVTPTGATTTTPITRIVTTSTTVGPTATTTTIVTSATTTTTIAVGATAVIGTRR